MILAIWTFVKVSNKSNNIIGSICHNEIKTFLLVPGYVTDCEIFDMRSPASKEDYLLSYDGEKVEEILSECGTVDELSDELVARIYENCGDECQDLQRQTYNDVHEFIEEAFTYDFRF